MITNLKIQSLISKWAKLLLIAPFVLFLTVFTQAAWAAETPTALYKLTYVPLYVQAKLGGGSMQLGGQSISSGVWNMQPLQSIASSQNNVAFASLVFDPDGYIPPVFTDSLSYLDANGDGCIFMIQYSGNGGTAVSGKNFPIQNKPPVQVYACGMAESIGSSPVFQITKIAP